MEHHKSLSRRDFMRVSIALSTGVLVPGAVNASSFRLQDSGPDGPEAVDVVIVGAGLAGLTAARELVKAGITSVRVLEAQGYVGGRIVNVTVDENNIVEGGGQFVGPQQTTVLALAEELGVGTFKSHPGGDDLYYLNGAATRYPPYDYEAFGEYERIRQTLDAMAQEIPLDSPWDAPDAERFDNMTFGDFLDELTESAAARSIYDLITFSSLNAHPEDISLLWVLYYIHAGVNINTLIAADGGAQDSRFVGGSQLLAIRMADELGLGERVLLNKPVESIETLESGGVRVVSGDYEVTCKRVIVAMMPPVIDRIHFTPALPEERLGLIQNWPKSGDIKVNVVYETPFWREAGLSGFVSQSDLPAVSFSYDNSPPDASVGILVAWPNLGDDPQLEDADYRRTAILEAFAAYFGAQALEPADYLETDWTSNVWNPACVSPVGTGVLTKFGRVLREPVGSIHWAGTETSDLWNGFMDGAVRSGIRVAEEVLSTL